MEYIAKSVNAISKETGLSRITIYKQIKNGEYIPFRFEKNSYVKPGEELTESQKLRNPINLTKKYYVKREALKDILLDFVNQL